jgi:hypothetical protein
VSKKLAVVVGFIGKLPYAGMSLYNLHYLVGLQELVLRRIQMIQHLDHVIEPEDGFATLKPSYRSLLVNLMIGPEHSHVRLSKWQAGEFVAPLEAAASGSAGQGRRHGRHDDG